MDAKQIAAGLSDAQKRALSVPHLLVIDNFECVPAMDWPSEMIAYQWPYYDALSQKGLAVRKELESKHDWHSDTDRKGSCGSPLA